MGTQAAVWGGPDQALATYSLLRTRLSFLRNSFVLPRPAHGHRFVYSRSSLAVVAMRCYHGIRRSSCSCSPIRHPLGCFALLVPRRSEERDLSPGLILVVTYSGKKYVALQQRKQPVNTYYDYRKKSGARMDCLSRGYRGEGERIGVAVLVLSPFLAPSLFCARSRTEFERRRFFDFSLLSPPLSDKHSSLSSSSSSLTFFFLFSLFFGGARRHPEFLKA